MQTTKRKNRYVRFNRLIFIAIFMKWFFNAKNLIDGGPDCLIKTSLLLLLFFWYTMTMMMMILHFTKWGSR